MDTIRSEGKGIRIPPFNKPMTKIRSPEPVRPPVIGLVRASRFAAGALVTVGRWIGERVRRPPSVPSAPRILATRTYHLGDVLVFLPTLRALRRRFPDAQIDVLAGTTLGAAVLADSPYVDHVVRRPGGERRGLVAKLQSAAFLHARQYDVVVASTQEVNFALNAFLTGARHRIGFQSARCNGLESVERYPWLYTNVLQRRVDEHEVPANLRLAEALGAEDLSPGMEYPISPEHTRLARALLERCPPSKWRIAVNLSSGRPAKNWPVVRYAKLIDRLTEKLPDLTVLIIGGADSLELAARLEGEVASPVYSLIGQTTIASLAGLLREVDVFVGSEGGPMHLATAVGTPVVAIHGPGDLAAFGPWASPEMYRIVSRHVPCSPCDLPECNSRRCTEEISVDEVLAATLDLLRVTRPRAGASPERRALMSRRGG